MSSIALLREQYCDGHYCKIGGMPGIGGGTGIASSGHWAIAIQLAKPSRHTIVAVLICCCCNISTTLECEYGPKFCPLIAI